MILTDASQNLWQKRWFVLRRYGFFLHDIRTVEPYDSRPYLHIYAHSNELEETGVIGLHGVNVESDPHKESLLGVSTRCPIQPLSTQHRLQKPFSFTIFTSSNSHALAASSLKEFQSWTSQLDPTHSR